MSYNNSEKKKTAMKTSFVCIVLNVALSVIKLIAGILGNSQAMLSDALHSLSDVFSTFVVIIGIALASEKSDKEHLYGHERLECVAAVILSAFLFMAGLGIGAAAVAKISGGGDISAPTFPALFAALVSIVVKELMYRYSAHTAKKINYAAVMADAWHHRSDALSSVGSLIGIGGAMMGFPILDPIAGIIICAFIIKAAIDIFKDSIDKMVDKSCDRETTELMKKAVVETDGVISLDLIRTRLFGSRIYVDIEISADKDLRLSDSHAIAENVHKKIETMFPLVKHCMVHVNPK